jgi:O-acetyl-ADP-ribose deacetylase (regulator of RNase III)
MRRKTRRQVKITYKKGNLLECTEKIIIHGCNAQGKYAAGVAKAIRAKYPYAYNQYKSHHTLLGLQTGIVLWADQENPLIGNMIIQEFYGREKKQYCSYDAIRNCIFIVNRDVRNWWSDLGPCVAMPKIGAGLAGGDWNIIEKIIEEETTDVQPVVYYL